MPMIDVSEEMKQRAIDLAAEGKYLRDILPQLGLKPSQFLKYRVRNPSFEREFNQARDMGRELIAENLGRLVDDDPFGDPQLLRLKSDNGWKLLAV